MRGGGAPPGRRALISVSDKRGVAGFARRLQDLGWEIISTGGTARILREAGVATVPVEALTGFPEILDGRVKTLHPAVHAGILARRDRPEHGAAMARFGLGTIDLVCVNLYPFEETVRAGASPDEALEQIDIGGPAMLRAAAKNHPHVIPVCHPEDYDAVADALAAGDLPADLSRRLAARAFAHTAFYDAVIAAHLGPRVDGAAWPERTVLPLARAATLRYGENPHQEAALYVEAPGPAAGLPGARQLQGKPLSYNNLLDAAAAWEAAADFDRPAAVAVKHGTPCGIAVAGDPRSAFERARDADPVSIFGGIVAFNRRVDAAAAEALVDLFLEVVLAPAVDDDALAVLARRKNLRVLVVDQPRAGGGGRLEDRRLRSVPGGLLVQSADTARPDPGAWRAVVGELPAEMVQDLVFAWTAVKHVRSNAIVVARNGVTLGIGGGQTNRVLAARIALDHAGEAARGAVVASDAFLPFADTVELCAQAGVAAIIQPGGSVRDDEVIEAARRLGVTMIFTGVRHFRH
ncbi:MAG TPA: bifunctional phosphoribosylaminoimidazolecarboxamide formyltransferase/IMP cyclohydrolase [Bacillota bacterium]